MELGAGARRRTLFTAGGSDIFVAALANDSGLDWAVRAGGTNSDAPGPIALGRDGAVAISGRTSNDGRGPARGTPDPLTVGDGAARAEPHWALGRAGRSDRCVPKKGCRKLPAEPSCRRSLWVCVGQEHSAGSRMETDSTYARVGISRGDLRRLLGPRRPARPRGRHDRAADRFLLPRGRGPRLRRGRPDATCEIVSADACLGLIGAVCARAAGNENSRAAPEVEEIRLRPSQ